MSPRSPQEFDSDSVRAGDILIGLSRRHRYGFRSWRGRFYFTSGEPEGNLWSTTVEAER